MLNDKVKKCMADVFREDFDRKIEGPVDCHPNYRNKLKNGEISKEEYDSYSSEVENNMDRMRKAVRDYKKDNPEEKHLSYGWLKAIEECRYNIFKDMYVEKYGWSESRADEYVNINIEIIEKEKKMKNSCDPVCTCFDS